VLIGELACAAGLPTQTIRFYERRGLLPDPERGANGYRNYDASTITRLHFIGAGQAAGLTLAEIGGIIDLRDDGTVPCTHVAGLVENKLAAVRARIASLTALETELGTLLERSRRLDPADCSDTEVCHILPARR
jgi:DNA-binding transcriptional MerR regulator